MAEMIRLLQNEWMKIFRRNSTIILIAILVGSVLLFAFVNSWGNSQQENVPWKEEVQQQLMMYEQQAANPEATDKELTYYEEQQVISEHRLEENIPPLERGSFGQFLVDSKSNLAFATLFTVIIASGIVASEFTWGTIKLLTIRPVKRGKILWAKYGAVLLFSFTIAIIAYVTSIISGWIFFDTGEGVLLTVENGEVIKQSIWVESLKLYGLSFVNLFIMTSFAFMVGTLSRSNALAIGLSIFLMFTGQQMVFLLQEYTIMKYYLFTHADLTQYLQPRTLVEGITPQFSIVVLIIYLVIFLTISHLSFTKRDIAT